MTNETNQDTTGQSGLNQETELRNRENETGEQAQQPQAGQTQQSPQAGQSQQPPQAGQQQQQQQQQPEVGQSDTLTKPQDNFAADKQGSEGGSGFVGSSADQSSDYLTKGEKPDFAPEGQGASNAGGSDIETGQSTNIDATLDDGSDTSQ